MFEVWDTYISSMEYFVKMIGDKALFKAVWYHSSWIEY